MKIGFIGGGNMGGAIIGGMAASGIYNVEDIFVVDIYKDTVEKLVSKYKVNDGENNKNLAKKMDILFLAVKPNVIGKVIEEIKDSLNDNCVVVSIAAGKSINEISSFFKKKIKLIRVMPNIPVLVGEGMAALCGNENVSDEELEKAAEIFRCSGRAKIVDEKMMDIVTAVSGSSPAFVYMFIEALADSAVLGGMPRNQAYEFAAQTVLGSAKMVLETNKHPGELKDMVCSPAGTTIEAVAELEKRGMRSAIIEAIRVCEEKSRSL